MIAAEVFLWGTRIGVVSQQSISDIPIFNYDERFLKSGIEVSPFRNHDDHVKNFSFLMDRDGKWHFAPSYDITYAYDKSNYWLARHQMSVNGKLEEISMKDLHECGKRMNISKKKIDTAIENVGKSIKKWTEFAQQAEVPELVKNEIQENLIFF